MDYYDKLQIMVSDVAYQIEGVSHLLTNYKPDGHGERDSESLRGIGLILEDLAKQGRKISNMLDSANRKDS